MGPTLYIGWRDLGARRGGRAWKLHVTGDRSELARTPWHTVGHISMLCRR